MGSCSTLPFHTLTVVPLKPKLASCTHTCKGGRSGGSRHELDVHHVSPERKQAQTLVHTGT